MFVVHVRLLQSLQYLVEFKIPFSKIVPFYFFIKMRILENRFADICKVGWLSPSDLLIKKGFVDTQRLSNGNIQILWVLTFGLHKKLFRRYSDQFYFWLWAFITKAIPKYRLCVNDHLKLV